MTGSEKRFTVEYLRECFDYRDGVLYWKERPAHHFRRPADHATFIKKSAGKPAGRNESKGYLTVKMRQNGRGVCITVHRIIWAMHHGKWPEMTVDHINRDKRDNRIENLRDVPMSVNLCNRGNPNGTGIPGVLRAGDKFSAQIRIGDNFIYLGTFKTAAIAKAVKDGAEEAALGVLRAARSLKEVANG